MLEEIQLQQVLPQEIEKRSFEIITEELGHVELDPLQAPIIKRAIHTSADFDYLKNLTFSEQAVEQFHTAIKNGEGHGRHPQRCLHRHRYADGKIRHQ